MAQNSLFLWINILISIIFLSKQGFGQLDSRPNIILVVTDDQDVVLHGLLPMEATQKHIGQKGMTFMNAYTSSPMCCPSRASILSGQYAHNHATINNSESGGCYGDFWKGNVELRTFPVFLQIGGYQTFFAGKYLNEYFDNSIPRGWNHFYGLHGNSRYYNYSLTENGEIIFYDDKYLTDVLNEKIIDFLRNQTQETTLERQPFFAMITPPAPHAPYTAAPRHSETFQNVKALRTPNFNLVSGPLDKHWLVAMGRKLSEPILDTLDLYYRKRWQSLMAVDELIENIIDELETSGEINNTYIIFTSDNGYHIGQFAQPFDKRQPYETDIRIPFLIRGPNIPEKSIANVPIALIDIFPTILDWAKIPQPGYEDGISINKYLENNDMPSNLITPDKLYHRQILIEHWGEGNEKTFNPKCPWKKSDDLAQCTPDADCHCQDSRNNTYSCIRHFGYNIDKLYCEFHDTENFVEAYDLSIDPYQMTNLGYELLPSERALYSIALDNLKHCTGENCRETKF